jgi:hypothetical protein
MRLFRTSVAGAPRGAPLLPGRGPSRPGEEPCHEQAEDEPDDVGEEHDPTQISHLIWGWSRRVKIRIGAVAAGCGRCRVRAGVCAVVRGGGQWGRAACDAGALWDTNP